MAEFKDRQFPVMENMTVKQIQQYLRHKKSIIIPIGVTEQHGYHLPLCADSLMATRLGRMAGERANVLVAPTVLQCFSGGELPGTINITPAVMSLVLTDMLSSLVTQGFRNLYLFICHGGSENMRAMEDAMKMLLRSNPLFKDVMIALLPVWKFSSPGLGWKQALVDHDWHAGWLETSQVMALAPELVRMEDLDLDEKPVLDAMIEHPDGYQQAEKIVNDKAVVPRITCRSDIRIGVMGYPQKASAELGRQINEDIVKNVAAKINELDSKSDGVYKQVPHTVEPLIL